MSTGQLYQFMIENDLKFTEPGKPGWYLDFINEDGQETKTYVTFSWFPECEDQNA